MPMDRAAYRCSIFLDDDPPAREGHERTRPAQLARRASWPPPPGDLDFPHRTLRLDFARALLEALDGESLVLREPLALRQLALASDRSLSAVLALLGRRYDADSQAPHKANVPVNFVLPKSSPSIQVPRLSSSIPACAITLARCCAARDTAVGCAASPPELAGYMPPLDRAGDAERAAALWMAQQCRFAAACQALLNARVLDASSFARSCADARGGCKASGNCCRRYTNRAASVAGPLFAADAKSDGCGVHECRPSRRQAASASDLGGGLLGQRKPRSKARPMPRPVN